MDKNEVIEILQPLNKYRVRQVDQAERSRVRVTQEMVALRPGSGGALVPLNDKGVKSLQKFTGVPTGLQGKLTPDTFGRLLTELLARKERYNMLMDEDEVVDFAEYHGTRTMAPDRVVRTIEQSIHGHVDFNRALVMENYSAMIEVVGEKRQAVVRGDVVRAGATVLFSPLNTVSPIVQSSVLRLICTNGMTAEEVVREYHGGGGNGDGNIWDWLRDSVVQAYGAIDGIVGRYRQMREDRITPTHRAAMLEALIRAAHITGADAEAVRAQALENPPRNAYEMMNLITWASSHVLREPERVVRARDAAAGFAASTEHAETCPVCHGRRN